MTDQYTQGDFHATVGQPQYQKSSGGTLKEKLNRGGRAMKNATKKAAGATKRAAQIAKIKYDIDACNKNIVNIKQDLGMNLYPLLDLNEMDNVMSRFRDAKTRVLLQQDAILRHRQALEHVEREKDVERMRSDVDKVRSDLDHSSMQQGTMGQPPALSPMHKGSLGQQGTFGEQGTFAQGTGTFGQGTSLQPGSVIH